MRSVTSSQRTSRARGSRGQQKAETRARLLAAARRCFDERGFHATHVAHISKAAGLAHGTFYINFKNKKELLDALLTELNEELRAELREALTADLPVPEKVRGAAERFLDLCAENRSFIECYAERLASGVEVEALRDGINPEVRALLAELLPADPGSRIDLTLAVHGLMALWIRVGLRLSLSGQAPGAERARDRARDRERAARTLTAMTLGALAALREADDAR